MTKVATTKTILSKINIRFAEFGHRYFSLIPLADLFAVCAEFGLVAVQEDGEPWSGLLCGAEGRAVIELRRENEQSRWLSLSWYRLEVTGRYEVTAYVS